VPRLRRLVVGLPPRRPGFDPGSVRVGFVVDKVALGQVFPPEYFGFPLSISIHRCYIKTSSSSSQVCTISLQGCGVSVASAAVFPPSEGSSKPKVTDSAHSFLHSFPFLFYSFPLYILAYFKYVPASKSLFRHLFSLPCSVTSKSTLMLHMELTLTEGCWIEFCMWLTKVICLDNYCNLFCHPSYK
jgi:hypothetical protein